MIRRVQTYRIGRVRSVAFAALAVLALVGGCASRSQDPQVAAAQAEVNDPVEPFNRFIFDINEGLDILLLRPVAVIYRDIVPTPLQQNVRSFLRNLRAPLDFGNNVLQGDAAGAETVAARFLINTTLGFGGIADVAAETGRAYEVEDFGQTLAVWGTGEGPYLVLPFLGPSNVRDTAGFAVDWFADPVGWYLWNNELRWLSVARTATGIVDSRSQVIDLVDDLRANSIDYYATVRSLYRQNRNGLIRDGRPATEEFPDFSDAPGNQSGTPRVDQPNRPPPR